MKKVLFLFLLSLMITSCATVKEKESFSEQHLIESMMSRMESLISKSSTIKQDSAWKESFIRELEKIREKNDTSHTVVLDTAGNVIRERIEIWHERETTSEKDSREREYILSQLEKIDSVSAVNTLLISRLDSLVRDNQKEKTVTRDRPWYQKIWDSFRYVAIGILAGAILMIACIILTRKWWKPFIKS